MLRVISMDAGMIVIVLLILSILVGVLLILIAYWKRKRLEPIETNYRAFYIMGIVLLPAGIVFSIIALSFGIPFIVGLPLLGLGAVYIAIGLSNRDKWKK
jgi:uncharacterized iron-regulated membrane protein